MIPKYEELSKMTDEELIRRYDLHAENNFVGTNFFLDELIRRKSWEESERMLEISENSLELSRKATKVAIMSLIVTALTSGLSLILAVI